MFLWVCLSIDHRRVAHDVQSSASMIFFPHFEVICDRLQNRRYKTDEQQHGVHLFSVSVWELAQREFEEEKIK